MAFTDGTLERVSGGIANNGVGFNTFTVTGANYTMTASRALTFA